LIDILPCELWRYTCQKKHIKSVTRGVEPLTTKLDKSFNGIAGATQAHAVQLVAGADIQGLNPAAARALNSSLSRKQISELKQSPLYLVYKQG
jgi:hypothetical protein